MAQSKSIGPEAICQESEVPDPDEPVGQYVQEEAAQELDCIKCHHA